MIRLMIAWTLMVSGALMWAGCQAEVASCEQSDDCFLQERCVQGRCEQASPLVPSCSPDDCAGPLVAMSACVAQRCVVTECVAQAVRCAQGCCERQLPSDGVLPMEGSLPPVVTLTPSGEPSVWSWDAKRWVLVEVVWDGLRWRRAEYALHPESLLFFDVSYGPDGSLHIAYTDQIGRLMYARRALGIAEFEIEEIAPGVSSNLPQPTEELLYLNPMIHVRAATSETNWVSVTALYGKFEQVEGDEVSQGLPRAWYFERPPQGVAWSTPPMS